MNKGKMFVLVLLVIIITGALIGYIISLILNEDAYKWIIGCSVSALISNICRGLLAFINLYSNRKNN